MTPFDLKFAKNVRFANRRLTVGVDVFNLFNSDAINSYTNTFDPDAEGGNLWGRPDSLVAPAVRPALAAVHLL